MIKRKVISDPYRSIVVINNKPPEDWDTGYELVVSFGYGLDEPTIAAVAGLRNYDTGFCLATGVRDLMFPCGTDKQLAYVAANRLLGADRFGALRIKISHPVEHIGKNAYTLWFNAAGKLIDRVKHRKLKVVKKRAKGRKS